MNNIITKVEELRDKFNSHYALEENAYQRACDDVIELLQNLKQCNVSGALPPDFEIEIYPSYDKGKWAAMCQGWISEPFDTPQDAFNWGVKQAEMTD